MDLLGMALKKEDDEQDALAKMQEQMNHAMIEDCLKIPATWVNNFRLNYWDKVITVVFSDAQDPTGRHMPRARTAVAMPLSMFEQMVEGIGPEYLGRIREAMKAETVSKDAQIAELRGILAAYEEKLNGKMELNS
jgi:hypothetical protein